MNSRRVLAVFKKDMRGNWLMIPLILAILLGIIYLLPLMTEHSETVTIGIVGEMSEFPPWIVSVTVQNREEGIKSVDAGEMDGVFVVEEKFLYLNETKSSWAEPLVHILSGSGNGVLDEEVVYSIDPRYLLLPILTTILIFVIGFIVPSMSLIDEKGSGTLNALFLTPLKYREFVVAKILFGFIATLIAALAYISAAGGFINLWPATMAIVVLASLSISLLGFIPSIFFQNTQSAIPFVTVLVLSLTMAETLSMMRSYVFFMPILNGLYRSIVLGELPLLEIVFLTVISGMLLIVTPGVLRRMWRRG